MITVYERELAHDMQTELGYFSAGTPVAVKAHDWDGSPIDDWDGRRAMVLAGHDFDCTDGMLRRREDTVKRDRRAQR